ncbi:MAG: hypothetical protein IPF99_30375 [Deltaproteobacteria bacterium]|jgi:hypothetical protein|nr:hypothetical protein [Deltaproteobacteria bacterium]MBP6830197.1 hypothetical protein [Deltaproteobacteria bacterium]
MSPRMLPPLPLPLSTFALLLTLLGAAFGCGGTAVSVPSTDSGVADVPDAPTDVPVVADLGAGCRLSDGSFCAVGASCPSPDRCNTCSCGPDGSVQCTLRACVDAGAPIVCGGSVGSFPTFDRSCNAASDCFVARHQTDCCGNSRAMGLNVSQRAAFEAAEAICAPMYPACGCPARPPVADDGNVGNFSTMIAVDCRAGLCTSYVPGM